MLAAGVCGRRCTLQSMAKKGNSQAVDIKALNRRLAQLKRWAAKAKDGSTKSKHVAARERWRAIKDEGLRPRCCGKPPTRRCKGCPAQQAQSILAPLKAALTPRAVDDLIPHPEGGAFRERYRANDTVAHPRGRGQRSALTLIHFRLRSGELSAWHRVDSDELWLHAGGDGVELLLWDGRGPVQRQRLGAEGQQPQTWAAVPAGTWQAARPLGEQALLHCVVAPGFDFADFELLRDAPPAVQALLREVDKAALTYC